MILLSDLRTFCEGLVETIEGLKSCEPITVEAGMAERVSSLTADKSPVLFYLPPSANGFGSVDSYGEDSSCILFVMEKYNPRTTTSAAVLEATQPIMEAVKAKLLEASRCPCHFMKIDLSSISTLPETQFFGSWAGWSVAFTISPN